MATVSSSSSYISVLVRVSTSALTTGRPLVKKSIMVANISGFISFHSHSSSCFVMTMKSGPKNTPLTPSILEEVAMQSVSCSSQL